MIKKPYLYWSTALAIFGLFVTGLGIAAIMLGCKFSDSAVPLWSGAWFLMAGLLGISASRNTYNTCVVGGHLVFCVIGIMYAINMTVLFATGAAEEEDVVEGGASLAARTAVDICLAVTGITHVILAVRCLAFASKVCCNGNDFSNRQRRSNSGRHRVIEVTGRNMEADVPQTPNAVLEPPSYAYINSTAPQSYGIQFANGSYPPAPPYADQPPSYSEVTSGAWTPASLQINISLSPASEPVTATNGADGQASESEIGQGSQTATTAIEDLPTDTPSTQCIQVEGATTTHETDNQDEESEDRQSSQSGSSVANETSPQQPQENSN